MDDVIIKWGEVQFMMGKHETENLTEREKTASQIWRLMEELETIKKSNTTTKQNKENLFVRSNPLCYNKMQSKTWRCCRHRGRCPVIFMFDGNVMVWKSRGMTMEHIEIVKEELRAYEENLSYALVTIVKTDGHTTRANGKMLVYEDGKILGTVGGGAIERLAVRDAVEAIRTGDGGTRFYDMNTDAAADGLACGGSMEVLIEVYGNRPTLVMCGAGHVGAALMPVARSVGFRIFLLDNRGEAFVSDKLCLADKFIPVKDYENDIKELAVPAGAYYVIAGPNHDCDGAALAGALTKESAYVGMIGGEKRSGRYPRVCLKRALRRIRSTLCTCRSVLISAARFRRRSRSRSFRRS